MTAKGPEGTAGNSRGNSWLLWVLLVLTGATLGLTVLVMVRQADDRAALVEIRASIDRLKPLPVPPPVPPDPVDWKALKDRVIALEEGVKNLSGKVEKVSSAVDELLKRPLPPTPKDWTPQLTALQDEIKNLKKQTDVIKQQEPVLVALRTKLGTMDNQLDNIYAKLIVIIKNSRGG